MHRIISLIISLEYIEYILIRPVCLSPTNYAKQLLNMLLFFVTTIQHVPDDFVPQGLSNIIAVDFDYRKEMIYWIDSSSPALTQRRINRMRLNGSDLKVR